MKHVKKIFAFALTLVMAFAIALPAFAATQTVPQTTPDDDNATITVNNPSKGQEYSIFKLFDATATSDGKIAYKGTVPATMTDFFEETSTGSGYVQAKPAAFKTVKYYADAAKTQELAPGSTSDYWTGDGMSAGLEAALENWAKTQTAVATDTSDGSEAMAFTGLPYGYYVITTDHEDDEKAKAIITVDSTTPSASIYDKNVTEPTAEKTVADKSYSIGDTVKYTATFDTTNYLNDANGKSWQVIEYTISDTLPAFLDASTVEVTKLTIDGADYKVSGEYPQFADKKIVIPWATKGADNKYTNNYDNGVKIVVEYQAVLTDVVRVDVANTNTVTITPKVTDDTTEKPWEENWSDDAEITTYAAALKKTDGTNELAGAKFMVNGLTVEKTADGVYTVKSYDATSTTAGTEMEVDEHGKLYIVGLKQGTTLKIAETKAPAGYNLLTGTTDLTPQVLSKEIYKKDGYRKYDAKGNIIEEVETQTAEYTQVTKNLSELDTAAVEIVNKQGTELPSTGGIGTTIFYIVGGAMVVGGGIFLLTKRRMANEA